MIDPQKTLQGNAQRSNEIHQRFLDLRKTTLHGVESLLKLQMDAVLPNQAATQNSVIPGIAPLFDANHLAEFATGSASKCFGPEYEPYENRRYPRIPNGELALINRVLEIKGVKRHFDRPASIISEYDVPMDAWFIAENNSPEIPYSIWMEIALQPCGFLSAYLGTMLAYPDQDFFFRNLDGQGRLQAQIDPRGKTIKSKARLLSTLMSGGTIIQRFDFELECEGQLLYQGNAVFGYFSPEAMARQAGLDGGKKTQPESNPADGILVDLTEPANQSRFYQVDPGQPYTRLARGRLNFLDQVLLSQIGGLHGKGFIYASAQVDPEDWFYRCHFYQDPVMPGSLGIESMIQAVQVFALSSGLGKELRSPRFNLSRGHLMTWRYRGQIIPDNRLMQIEAHLTHIDRTSESVTIGADASLWADDVRIYEVKGISLQLISRNG